VVFLYATVLSKGVLMKTLLLLFFALGAGYFWTWLIPAALGMVTLILMVVLYVFIRVMGGPLIGGVHKK